MVVLKGLLGMVEMRRFAIFGDFVGINRPQLTVDRIQLCLELVLPFENRSTRVIEPLTVHAGQLQC